MTREEICDLIEKAINIIVNLWDEDAVSAVEAIQLCNAVSYLRDVLDTQSDKM